ncbi:hypothetical protein MUB23_04015 [Cuneatibacter sp. NSJ-177]|uniref:phage tail assembly chaperone n=1 Tax=Cuneatibacter sp. NSJ-177 TaxID=2931401 RepID=UPI001FD2F70B|nr:hypothetical protein [Cuneatibacter sp. NSJ-177]MCJ7834560.1 hypothetical protein [Cuneatibacter sp. NSJ-177]
MSKFTRFLKQNKMTKANAFYPATKSLVDEQGKPLQWEIRALSTREDEAIREACMKEIPIPGKPHMYRPKLDSNKYLAKMVAESVVCPNLYDAELQDSYGVTNPEDLVREMVDNPGEYQDLAAFVQNFSGFDVSMEQKVDEAKN